MATQQPKGKSFFPVSSSLLALHNFSKCMRFSSEKWTFTVKVYKMSHSLSQERKLFFRVSWGSCQWKQTRNSKVLVKRGRKVFIVNLINLYGNFSLNFVAWENLESLVRERKLDFACASISFASSSPYHCYFLLHKLYGLSQKKEAWAR